MIKLQFDSNTKYIELAIALKELIWLQTLLKEFGHGISLPIIIYFDN